MMILPLTKVLFILSARCLWKLRGTKLHPGGITQTQTEIICSSQHEQ